MENKNSIPHICDDGICYICGRTVISSPTTIMLCVSCGFTHDISELCPPDPSNNSDERVNKMYGLFVRHRGVCGGRIFEPLKVDHHLVKYGIPCVGCGMSFVAGDKTVLVPIGPGTDPEDQEKARANRWYTATAVAVHATCAGQKEEADVKSIH